MQIALLEIHGFINQRSEVAYLIRPVQIACQIYKQRDYINNFDQIMAA